MVVVDTEKEGVKGAANFFESKVRTENLTLIFVTIYLKSNLN